MNSSIISMLLWVSMAFSCVSLDSEEERPVLGEKMSTKEVVDLGLKYGGEVFEEAKSILQKRNARDEVHALTTEVILSGKAKSQHLWRAVNLFQASSRALISPKVVDTLIRSENMLSKQMGWLLAANRPSDLITTVIQRYLTQTVMNGDEDSLLLPEMALAVKANRLSSAYSLLRMGLMNVGGVEFVDAMVELSPLQARVDFMDYLALATIEDLRQMNQKTVDLQSCISILRFFVEKEAPLGHPRFEHLFLYAVSRNTALAELSSSVLEKYMTDERDQLAYTLARLPVWVQLAYVEGTRDRMNANLGLFLGELKVVTAHKEVIEEIVSLRR